jgi:hypothetical protein
MNFDELDRMGVDFTLTTGRRNEMRSFVAVFKDKKTLESFEYAVDAVDESHVDEQIACYLKIYKGRKFVSYYEVKERQ